VIWQLHDVKQYRLVPFGTPRSRPRHVHGLRFTAKVFAPFYSEKQDYCGTKIKIPVRNRQSEQKIQEFGGFRQEYATVQVPDNTSDRLWHGHTKYKSGIWLCSKFNIMHTKSNPKIGYHQCQFTTAVVVGFPWPSFAGNVADMLNFGRHGVSLRHRRVYDNIIVHTKSNPQNSEIAQAVVDGRVDPAHSRVAHGVRVTSIWWVEGVCPLQPMVEANAAPIPWSRGRNHSSFVQTAFGRNMNSGGIHDSGVIRRNTPPAKRRFLWKKSSVKTRIQRNPEES